MREEDRLANLEFRLGKNVDLLNVDLNKWLCEKATVQIWRSWNRQAWRIFHDTFGAVWEFLVVQPKSCAFLLSSHQLDMGNDRPSRYVVFPL